MAPKIFKFHSHGFLEVDFLWLDFMLKPDADNAITGPSSEMDSSR